MRSRHKVQAKAEAAWEMEFGDVSLSTKAMQAPPLQESRNRFYF